MPAGFSYSLNPMETEKELCRVDTIYRLSGGFNLDDDKLVAGSYLPHLAPLAIDFATRKAIAVKNVKVYENATSSATSVKIEKNSLAYVGMTLGTGSAGAIVNAIDASNADYDTLTLAAAFGASVTKGQVLFEASAAGGTTVKNVANFLNYARVKVESGATITAVARAFEIDEANLTVPIASKNKTSMQTAGAHFIFV